MNYIDTPRYELDDKIPFTDNDWKPLIEKLIKHAPEVKIQLTTNDKVCVHVTTPRFVDIVDLLPYKPEYIDSKSNTISYIPCPQSN